MLRRIHDRVTRHRLDRRLEARFGARLHGNDLRSLELSGDPPPFGPESEVQSSVVSGRVAIGRNCVIRESRLTAAPGAAIRIGRYTVVNEHSLLAAKHHDLTIGNLCTLGLGAALLTFNHRMDTYTTSYLDKRLHGGSSANSQSQGPISLGHDCTIGLHSVVMPGVTLGNGCLVLPNSVVMQSFPAFRILGGVPATEIGRRFSEAKASYLESLNYWEWDHARIVRNLPRLLRRVSTKEPFDG